MPRKGLLVLRIGLAVVLLTASGAKAVDIENVFVGNAGNPGEWSGESHGGFGPDRMCGAVHYEYNIGKYEVTAGQYTELLNAVAADDTYGLYNTNMADTVEASGCNIQRGGDPDDPCPDVFSGNNDRASAADVGSGSLSGLSICPGVSDWFRLPANLGSSARVTITFQHSAGDLDMKAYDAGGSQLNVSQGTSDTETLDVDLSGDVYIEVYGYSNAANTFGLDVQVD